MTEVNPPDESAIGQQFRNTPRTAVTFAIVIVVLDFVLVSQQIYGEVRACVALIAFAFAVQLSDGDLKSLGLRSSPIQGWYSWIFTSLKLGGIFAVCLAVGFGIWVAMGHRLIIPVTAPSQAWSRFMQMCFVAPTVEETIYRIAACGLIAAIIGNRPTIAINGFLFGFLHVLYGNPSPENLIGGFFLAWTYLKSESIFVPFLFHSAGNGLVLLGQIAGWYLLGEAA